MSTLSPDLSDYANAAKLGYQLGAFVRIGGKLHLQPEVYFGLKTGELKYVSVPNNSTQSVNVKQDVNLNTIDIPILLGYRILKVPTLNVRLQAGPVASIVANKTFNVSFDGVDKPEDQSPIEKSSLKDMNWGLQMGAGVDFLFLTVDVRYELGLSNIYDKPANSTSDLTLKNNVFILSVGWKIL